MSQFVTVCDIGSRALSGLMTLMTSVDVTAYRDSYQRPRTSPVSVLLITIMMTSPLLYQWVGALSGKGVRSPRFTREIRVSVPSGGT